MGIDKLPDVVTVKQLADFLQINAVTITRALQKKEMIGFKIGNDWRIYREDVAEWLEKLNSKKQ